MRKSLLVALGMLGLTMWLAPEDVWARAGGGGSFGGGSSGGGGGFGGSSGSGDGDLIGLLIWLCIQHPAIGVPLAIVVFLGLGYGGTAARNGHLARTIRRGRQAQASEARRQAKAALRSRDAAFEETRFLNRCRDAFLKIQEAWSRQDLVPVRAFISDGIHQRFSLQISMQQAEGWRNRMESVHVLDAEIVAIHSDEHFDTLHVMIRASAVDNHVDLATGRHRGGTAREEEFVEYWSFHRRPGAQSLSRPGAIEGNCPNCGAPLEIVDQTRCTACGSIVNSGEHDWVLAEITQEQEWQVPAVAESVPGWRALQEADGGLSVQHIEDRASVMFWRLRAAEFFGDSGYAAPVLAPDGNARRMLDAALAGGTERRFWQEPAVGGVELIDARQGEPGGTDRLRVKVRWSGIHCEGNPTGRHRVLRQKSIDTHVYVLARRHGISSSTDQTFSSASCTNCGAPIAVSTEAACQFCGTLLNDGGHDWVLEDVQRYTAELAYQTQQTGEATHRVAPGSDGAFAEGDTELSLAVLARIMVLDGHLDEKERRALEEVGHRRGLTPAHVEAVLNTAADGDETIPLPKDARQARDGLTQIVHAVMADGRITAAEKKLLSTYARRTNMAAADVRLALARERRRQYQQARQVLKQRRLVDVQ